MFIYIIYIYVCIYIIYVCIDDIASYLGMEKDIVTSLADRHEIFGDADAANLGALGIPKIFQSDSYFFWVG